MDLSIYVVTDAQMCAQRGLAATVRAAVRGGATIIQYRDKTNNESAQLRDLEQLAQAISGRATLIVNDHVATARTALAHGIPIDGVHLGQGDGSVEQVRALLGPNAIIGLTANTHDQLAHVARLADGTVDYLGVGVIRDTSTKPDHPPALGIHGFSALAATTRVPCVAIGGIGRQDIASIKRAGGAGVAVVSAVCAAPDPEAAARALRSAWDGA